MKSLKIEESNPIICLTLGKKIPGMKDDYSIDEKIQRWINTIRELAKHIGRLDEADMEIGNVLVQYPNNIPECSMRQFLKL